MHQRADGQSFPADVLLTRLDLAGKPVLHCTVRDVTHRKAEEETTRRRGSLDAMHWKSAPRWFSRRDSEIDAAMRGSIVTGSECAFARIWMLEPETDTLVLCTSVGLYTHLDGSHSRVKVGERKVGRIAATRRADRNKLALATRAGSRQRVGQALRASWR